MKRPDIRSASCSRRMALLTGAGGAAAPLIQNGRPAKKQPQLLRDAIDRLEPYWTAQKDFQDVSRGKPVPHSLSAAEKERVGLTRDSWRLEVLADPDAPAEIENPLTGESALTFDGLMTLAETHAVRFPKIMTCLNIGCPLGMGIWEGVPLREVLWLTRPRSDWRRVAYYGFHNNAPEQLFRSSLSTSRVLEDPSGLPPVILCYKLNGQWLSSERGGPVRIVVPEHYGFKSIKWLSHILLSNLSHANDTYAEKNNDVDSPLKTFAATIEIPTKVAAQEPFAITGYAQSGIAGLDSVQVWLERVEEGAAPQGGFNRLTGNYPNAQWQEAEILEPADGWAEQLPGKRIPGNTFGFNNQGQPDSWPMMLSKVYWAYWCTGLPKGKYAFRCRTVDSNGIGQPMPRPFRKSGHAAIEKKTIVVS